MSSPVTAQLILIQGDSENFQPLIELENTNRSIGRAQNCDIIWGSLQISRKHATLEYNVPTWYIRDTSTNGLSVNGIKLVKGELFPLKDTDIISFIPTGTVRYRFRYIVTASPTRGSPPSRPTARSISPQPSTSNSALASASASISRSNVNASVSNSRILEGHISDSSEDSNHSESLLSLDPPDDFLSFSADENAQSPSVDPDSDNASSGPLVSKRKHKGDFSSDDSDSIVLDKKRKRLLFPASDEDSSKSENGSHLPSGSSNFKTLRTGLVTEDQISKCDDLETLKAHLRDCMTKLKSTEVNLETIKCERAMEREEFRRKERDVRSVNTAFREETYKKILELMESELSCSVCNEVFIQATVIDCGHTFCQFCINEWARKKPECPICRKSFRNRSRHIEMENFISRIFESFTEEIAAKRKITIKERDDQAKKAVEDARAAATENQARNGGNNFQAFIQTTAERYVDFLAELHQINEILGPRGNTAERRRSARIQDRVIDAVVAGAGAAGAQGPVRGRYQRGRGRSGAAVGALNANNPQGAGAPSGPQPSRAAAAGRQMPSPINPIPVVTLNDTDDGANAGNPVVRLPNIPNQFMNYVRRIPLPQLNLMGEVNRNGAGPN